MWGEGTAPILEVIDSSHHHAGLVASQQLADMQKTEKSLLRFYRHVYGDYDSIGYTLLHRDTFVTN